MDTNEKEKVMRDVSMAVEKFNPQPPLDRVKMNIELFDIRKAVSYVIEYVDRDQRADAITELYHIRGQLSDLISLVRG